MNKETLFFILVLIWVITFVVMIYNDFKLSKTINETKKELKSSLFKDSEENKDNKVLKEAYLKKFK